jgi:hypothetical protein
MIRYARAPSLAFRQLLATGGLLAPLLAQRIVAGVPLDVHLREGDHLHVYCGLTRIVDAWLAGGRVRVDAHKTYTSQACGEGLFRSWTRGEAGFSDALDTYMAAVAVGPAFVRREGAVQAAWAQVRSPWTPFDREAVLGYRDTAAQTVGRAFPQVAAARAELERLRLAGRWAPMPEGKVGAELDQLAVDPGGRLVLVELKDAAASPASVFYAPLQLLQYVHEWAAAFDGVKHQLDAILTARIALGMSPPEIPRLVGGLRPVVGFGPDVRSAEVRARFETVLAVVNRHLPDGAAPMEAWGMGREKPTRLG